MKLKFTQKIVLKLLVRILNVDRDEPVLMFFEGDDKVFVQKSGASAGKKYKFFKSHYKMFKQKEN